MKKSNKKIVIYIIFAMLVISLVLGTIGLIASKNENSSNSSSLDEDSKDYKVSYKYYIDSTEVKDSVEQKEIQIDGEFEGSKVTIKLYTFDKYICTNNVEGKWDDENWEFTPELTSNSVCRLYFNKNIHDVKIMATNGKLPNNTNEETKAIEINKEGTIKIIPNDGYKFNGVNCTNDAKAEYNNETNDLTIKNVTKDDTTCTITFGVSDYTINLSVEYGSPATSSKSVKYGENVVFNVTPSQNYDSPLVECKNHKDVTYSNGELTINSVTSNDECSVKFSYSPSKYNVTLKVNNGILISNESANVFPGKTAIFVIDKNSDAYSLTDPEMKCTKLDGSESSVSMKIESQSIRIDNVDADLNCEVTLKEATD